MQHVESFVDTHLSLGRYEAIILISVCLVKIACGSYLYLMNTLPFYIQRDYFLTDGQLALLLTCFQLGQLVGGVLSGQMLDRLGRAPSIRICIGLTLMSFGLLLLPFRVEIMGGLALILGCFCSFTVTAFNTLVSEITPFKHRAFWLVVVSTAISIGRLVGALASAFLLSPYRFELWGKAICLGGLVLATAYCVLVLLIRESVKYLYSKHRYTDMYTVVQEIQSFNFGSNSARPRVTRDDITRLQGFQMDTQTGSKNKMITSLFHPRFAYISLATFINFSIFFMLMNGHVLTLPKLIGIDGKSLWTSVFIISGEVVASIICIFIINHPWVGGKRLIIASCLATAALFMSVQFTSGLFLPIAMFLVRICLKANLVGWSVYTSNAFPTLTKGRAFGVSTSCGGLSNTFFPTIFLWLFNWQRFSVLWLMSSLSLVAAVMTVFLPADKQAIDNAHRTD